MDLILWRHAEAEIGEPDDGRLLTSKGIKQANRMAEWLDRHLPNSCKILVSPASRTVQTAKALHRKSKIDGRLAQDTTAKALMEAANWPNAREPVVLVGHQPALGQLAALLVAGVEQNWTIKKGSIWWIARRDQDAATENYVRAVVSPDLMTR